MENMTNFGMVFQGKNTSPMAGIVDHLPNVMNSYEL